MKKIATLFAFVVLTLTAQAQCVNPYYQIKEGTVMVQENYNPKDKLMSRNESRVIEYQERSNGFTAKLQFKAFDKKDKEISGGEYSLTCENNVMKIDMSNFVPAESMQSFGDMEVSVSMDQLEYPQNLAPGTKLNDGHIVIETIDSPIPIKLQVDITNRVVEGKETITVPSGTYECTKISYDSFTKVSIMKYNFKTIEYLSNKAGIVKTESYKSNGKLSGITLLTKYEY